MKFHMDEMWHADVEWGDDYDDKIKIENEKKRLTENEKLLIGHIGV